VFNRQIEIEIATTLAVGSKVDEEDHNTIGRADNSCYKGTDKQIKAYLER